MGSPIVKYDYMDLSGRPMSKSLRFLWLVYHKGAELGYILPLITNKKWYMTSPNPTEPSHVMLGDVESFS